MIIAVKPESFRSLHLTALKDDEELGTATGFIVEEGGDHWLVTNWHVLSGRDVNTGRSLHTSAATPNKLRVKHNSKRLGKWVDVTHELRDDEDRALWLEDSWFGR